MSVNKVILIGNVGKDAEVKTFASGSSIAEFNIATSETYTNKSGEKVTNTEWHNIKCLSPNIALIAGKYVKKGMSVYIEGKIKTETWGEGENKKYKTVINCDTIQFLGAKKTEQAETTQQPEPQNNLIEDTGLPF